MFEAHSSFNKAKKKQLFLKEKIVSQGFVYDKRNGSVEGKHEAGFAWFLMNTK